MRGDVVSRTKVLLVDDEVEFASALAERLRLRDYDATAVYAAEDALAAVRDASPDVVLLDMRMPGMDGMETLRAIKTIDPRIEVIMLTGYGEPHNVEEGLKSGAFEYIMKPVDIEQLALTIQKAKIKRDAEG